MSLIVHSETWRAVPGFDGLYEVSDLGRVRSYLAHGGKRRLDRPKGKATFANSRSGYLSVTLQKESGRSQAYHVHVLVALAFLGPRPDGLQVAHADGDRSNSRLENLRYATPVENAQDKHRHGTTRRGEADGNAKLSEAQVAEIRDRYRLGEYQTPLAAAFGISQSQVSNIVRGASWSHLPEGEAV